LANPVNASIRLPVFAIIGSKDEYITREADECFSLLGQSLKSVAESTGFSDAFHLSKTFKRLEGAAPKHFLASLRAGR
jgi:AraC-like DNA-binding protein